MTEVIPAQLTLVSMDGGAGYDCATLPTCVAKDALGPSQDGAPITVTAVIKDGFVGTAHNVAYVSPDGDDVIETNPLVVPTTDTDTGSTDTDNDAQADLTGTPVSIGDYVWFDTNRDGQQGFGEAPAAGVTVNLYDSAGALVGSKTTDAWGFYSFVDLVPGASYTVEFVKPPNTVFTAADQGTDAADSDADVTTGKVSVTAPASGSNSPTSPDDPTIDAGLVKLVSVGDYVWYDRNRDGAQGSDEPAAPGVTVNLYDANNTLVDTAVTDANGFYSFTDLLAGATYTVEFVKPADTVFTTPNNAGDAVDSDAAITDGKVTVTAPPDGANSATTPDDPTIDAGLVELVSIGDYVWFDANRDGIQTAGELPVAGVTVNLYDSNNALAGTAVTDANGFYSFTGLIGGATYTVEFVKPANTVFTSANAGADDTVDSDAAITDGKVTVVTPASGANSATNPDDPTIDAGLVKLVSVGDHVWFDTNRDGLQSAGEPVVPGVTVKLYDAQGAQVATTVTDGNGFYSFTDLLAGAEYTIWFVKPDGTSFTTALAGDVALDSNADVNTGGAPFTAPIDGTNSATTPDNPTIDAGLVKLNLSLTKVLVTTGTVRPGDQVSFVVTPHNDGPVDALAGWSVTEVLPSGLTLVSMSGSGYTCTGVTCVADGVLAAGADGEPITVLATVGKVSGKVHNVAYVSPSGEEVPETNPLVVPSTDTDTDSTGTDNDAQADLLVPSETLPQTGTGAELALLGVAGALVLVGTGFLLVARRRRAHN